MKFRSLVVNLIFVSAVAVLMFISAGHVAAQAGSGESPVPTPAPPGPVDPGQIPALPDFLETLAGPGGWLALGALASMLLGKWAWYNQQPDAIKRAIPIGIAAVVSMLSRLLVTYVPANFWAVIADYWLIVAGTVTTWLGSQIWHRVGIKPFE